MCVCEGGFGRIECVMWVIDEGRVSFDVDAFRTSRLNSKFMMMRIVC